MKKLALSITAIAASLLVHAQGPIKEYVNDKGKEKIMKSILIDRQPETHKSFKDGHGVAPYLTSEKQIPDTIALITFYVYDVGSTVSTPAFVTTYSLSEKGGNYFANKLHAQAIGKLKESFKSQGIVLLTPDEYLDTEEKRNFYYNKFTPEISKLGNFLSGLETKHHDIAVCADYYRGFDVAASLDFKRSQSLGGELCKKLGVDGVLSIAVELQHDGKNIHLNGVKWAINGPNLIPKEDKKYVGQNVGTGYYDGQTYFKATMFLKKGIRFAKGNRKGLQEENYEGFEDILPLFAEKSVATMKSAIARNSK